ncbi:uncharacterized protein BDCG_07845 [Blastomyces dermatitidis ER-3]|uniref:Uncharacterized protein n=2 Tax=Ajellomyces dermatitidis TaxID=5039 RepID=F2TSC9_AJEDA|nr:uncharacterized protein BDCG_07845 [Blastomyces dermatitidis ER-3]EEQ84576.2 hypothetical protein BDCG_07845 [Blastomyces dermatitidis ER-3]EGE86142.2 hypothetical protein BDDG_09087 [Blastomyces dermatitidis ATCC 18188]EQL30207.1 hypothetical protein BDFG_07298 [Blastomyces dermatitidis ATCC 26199]
MVTINLFGAGWDGSTNGTKDGDGLFACFNPVLGISLQEGKFVSNRLEYLLMASKIQARLDFLFAGRSAPAIGSFLNISVLLAWGCFVLLIRSMGTASITVQ